MRAKVTRLVALQARRQWKLVHSVRRMQLMPRNHRAAPPLKREPAGATPKTHKVLFQYVCSCSWLGLRSTWGASHERSHQGMGRRSHLRTHLRTLFVRIH